MIKLLLLITLLFSCAKKVEKSKDTLNIALTTNISTLDPAVSYDTVSARVVYQMYESLYEYDYLIRPYQLKPLLAVDFPKIENDGLKYTIKIKPGVFYHDDPSFKGKPREVIAQDFINQLKRVAYPGTQSNGWWLFENKIKGLDEFRKNAKKDFSDFFSYPIAGLQTPDKHTLVINLKKKYPQLIYALSMAFATPVSKEVIQAYKNSLNLKAVGTGPYRLVDWKQNSILKVTKNTNYHKTLYPSRGDSFAHDQKLLGDANKELPFIKNINFHIMKEAQTRWLNFLKKKIDIITLSKDHFPLALSADGKLKEELVKDNVKLQLSPTLTFWWLSFNMTDPVLGKNLKLRQAIAHAIDTDRYIKDFTNSIGLKANSIYPPGVPGYSPMTKLPYKHDKELAKKLLAEAGFPNGEGLPKLTYDVRSASTVARQMGEFIEKELESIGIEVDVIINSFQGFLNKAKTGQLQIWQGGWAMDYPDPENVIQLLISKNHAPGPNTAYYSSPVVDSLYKELADAGSEDELRKITTQVENQVNKDLPWIMQYYSRNYILYHDYLGNFRQSDLINNYFKYLKLK